MIWPLLLAMPVVDTSTQAAHAAFFDGDLVSLARAQVQLAEAGKDPHRGDWGLLEDLSRLVRCLPLGPVPDGESPQYFAVRSVVRLERIRLQRLLVENAYRDTDLVALLNMKWGDHLASQPELVRWPTEIEVWPGEVTEAQVHPGACPPLPGSWRDPAALQRKRQQARLASERKALAALLPQLGWLPDEGAARIALAYLQEASIARTHLTSEWVALLNQALARGEGPVRVAGRLALARLVEDYGDSRGLYSQILADPDRSAAQDSRARVRLVALLEPEWTEILALTQAARPRPEDRAALENAEARARLALGDYVGLQKLGRQLLVDQRLSGCTTDCALTVQTRELLLRLSLVLPVPEALAWADELAGQDRGQRLADLETLGALALEASHWSLAVALYDRLRLEAAQDRGRLGPRAAAEEARWLAARIRVELARRDLAAFGGLLDELLALADAERARPLARFAPQRELARLTQDLLGQLVNLSATDSEASKYAAFLLEANQKLSATPSRWRPILEKQTPALITLAGPWAKGRAPPLPKDAARVHQLGEVSVPRLPPRLSPPDHPTPLPPLRSLLVYRDREGRWQTGAPWAHRIPKRVKR